MKNGFIKVAAATPRIRVADPHYNADELIRLTKEAHTRGVDVLTFPELCLTGATCGDLFSPTRYSREPRKLCAPIWNRPGSWS